MRMTPEDIRVCLNVTVVLAIVATLWFLAVILCREWVKTDLREKELSPHRVRWRPFRSTRSACCFDVQYSDATGVIHKAQCWTYWHRPSITWESDETIGKDTFNQA